MYNLLLSPAPFAVVSQFPVWFTAVYVLGFLAAVGIGSVAWYNSKRPAGWEDAERPDYIPDMQSTENEAPEDQA